MQAVHCASKIDPDFDDDMSFEEDYDGEEAEDLDEDDDEDEEDEDEEEEEEEEERELSFTDDDGEEDEEDEEDDEVAGVDAFMDTGHAQKLGFSRVGPHDEADVDVRRQPWKQEDS